MIYSVDKVKHSMAGDVVGLTFDTGTGLTTAILLKPEVARKIAQSLATAADEIGASPLIQPFNPN